jgi:hypothetical protein
VKFSVACVLEKILRYPKILDNELKFLMTKKSHIIVILIVALCVIGFAALLLYQPQVSQPPGETVVAGVVAGDVFTYDIRAYATIIDENATVPENFYELNMTEWYRVTITQVNDSEVSFSSTWRFSNGTEIDATGKVNIETGIGNSQDFWAIYASGLEAGDWSRPFGFNRQVINATEKRTYESGERETNSIRLENTFYETDDPTGNSTCESFRSIYFDKQTGMLVEFVNSDFYSNPQLLLMLKWKIVDTNVWNIT